MNIAVKHKNWNIIFIVIAVIFLISGCEDSKVKTKDDDIDYGFGATHLAIYVINNSALDLYVGFDEVHGLTGIHKDFIAGSTGAFSAELDAGIRGSLGQPVVSFYYPEVNPWVKLEDRILIKKLENTADLFELVKKDLFPSKYKDRYFGEAIYKFTITDEMLE